MKQVTALILVLTLLTGCTGGAGGSTTPMHSEEASVGASLSSSPAAETEAPPVALNIALVHTLSGLGDKSMNDNAFSGLEMAAKDFGITFTNVEPKEASDFETMLMQLSNSGEYDLIFSMSNEQLDALEKVAPLFPEQKYSAISYICKQPNVSSLYLKFEEFVFTAGYLAGALTKSGALPSLNDDNVIGIVYARDVPVQTAPAVGYIAGAKLANGDVEVLTGVVGDFLDVNKAKEIALNQYGKGADIIQQFAGKAGLGVLNAAEEAGGYAMGVSVNQNDIAPGNIIASTLTGIHMQVYNEIKALQEGQWEPTIKLDGLHNDIFTLTTDGSTVEVPPEIMEEALTAQQRVADGEIILPTSFEELDAWIAENID